MDRKPFVKILNFIDEKYYEYNNMANIDGFAESFEETIFSKDYLDIDDFISYHIDTLNYNQFKSLTEQYEDIPENDRDKLIEAIYNIIFYSEMNEDHKVKIASYLARYNVLFDDSNEYKYLIPKDSVKCVEGSYGKVFFVSDMFVKKQLKSEYWLDKDVASRFKNEYSVQNRLYQLGADVLEVYDYDAINHSYIMQRATEDLEDYIKENILSFNRKTKLIEQILATMKLAHNNEIMHRDLHIGNVLMVDGRAVIADFGFAKDSKQIRSKLSTVTPKPTHIFLAPEGYRNFTELDYTSDIYSVGKIIDYIMGNGEFGKKHQFKLLVEICINMSKMDRFQTIQDLEIEFNNVLKIIKQGENISEINSNIENGIFSTMVEAYILNLVSENSLSKQIVANNWSDFEQILEHCQLSNQLIIIRNINESYIEATGYNGWKNYDLFGMLAYKVVNSEMDVNVRKLAFSILENCAKIRFEIRDIFESIPNEISSILKV